MFKRSRIFISAVLVVVLSVSALILSGPLPARACPVDPPPQTLLTLYLRSNLIVVAEIASEKDGETINEYPDYVHLRVNRQLKVLSTLKGTPPADMVFTKTEYRVKNKPQTDASDDEEDAVYTPYGYKGSWELLAGERYLFFFVKDPETGAYDLTDEVSGAKRLADRDLDVHLKRIKELQSIEKLKKNQLEAVTKWLIRCVEEPSTRWDGVFDLRRSFDALDYEESERAEKSDAQESDEEASREPEFKLDEDFNSRHSAIAKNLSESQKQRLSNIAFSELQQNPSLIEHNYYFYYSLPGLATRWDKTRLAMYAFGILQSVDPNDAEKTHAAMSYLSDIVDDDGLTEIVERYPASDAAEEAADDEKTDAAETTAESADQPAAPETAQNAAGKVETIEVKASPKAKKPTPAEIRQSVLRDFVDRYQFLLANGFEVDDEEEAEAAPEEAIITNK